MAIEVRQSVLSADVNIVELSGRLDMATADADSPTALQALEESRAGVVYDLAGVDFISSAGLRMLIAASQRAQATGKQIALVRAQPGVYKIFKVASLDQMFRFVEGESEAVEALRQ
jgi:anti-anti-sigma factor